MFIAIIAQVVLMLVVISIINSNINTNVIDLRFKDAKIESLYNKEYVIRNTYQNWLDDGGDKTALPTINALKSSGYFSSNFTDDNNFENGITISLTTKDSVLEMCHDISDAVAKKRYVSHFKGSKYGIKPYVKTGDTVCHEYSLDYDIIKKIK